MLYRKDGIVPLARQLTWFDSTGRQLGRLGDSGNYGDVEISPNDDRVAFDSTVNGNRDIWMIDIARAVPSRITFESSSDWNPLWSPDGSRIAFAPSKPDAAHIYEKPSGVGTDQLVFQDQTEIPVDWSHDGRYIVFSRLKGSGKRHMASGFVGSKESVAIYSVTIRQSSRQGLTRRSMDRVHHQ